jgi:hypothetical protein
MKKKNQSRNTLIFLLCLILNFSLQAQTHKYFIISGNIISDSSDIQDRAVKIIKNNRPAVISMIPENGRFRLELDYNCNYQLTFVEKGFLSKTINVNTDIPEEISELKNNYPQFLISVKLFRDNQDAENLYTGNIIQQINYSPQEKKFVRASTIYDQEYVEKLSSGQNQSVQLQESKSKLNTSPSF